MAAAKSSLRDRGARLRPWRRRSRLRQRPFLVLAIERRVGLADILARVLLLLDAEDVGRALGAGEQVLAVLGVEEFAQRLDAADDQHEVVLTRPSANTASTRSCRAPCSRSWTFRRSAKKERRSHPQRLRAHFDELMRSQKLLQTRECLAIPDKLNRLKLRLSSTIRITPSAARRSA